MTECCPCDRLEHPGKPDIPAGLTSLPRQLAGFPEYRLAMLRDIANSPPLNQWRGREGNDLGIMLLEMWAYVLDILGFYDQQIANETYLRTAIRSGSLYRLIRLIGYHPRPPLAASVVLAAIADGKKPVILPPRTLFRSDAFGDEPPQLFETEIVQTIHPFLNEWTLAQVRESLPNGNKLLLDLGTARLAVGQLVLLRRGTLLQAGRVSKTQAINALDGNTYLQVEIDPPPTLPDVPLADIKVLSPTLSASPNLLNGKVVSAGLIADVSLIQSASVSGDLDIQFTQTEPIGNALTAELISPIQSGSISGGLVREPISQTAITLDTIYPQFGDDDPVIIQRGNTVHCARIVSVERRDIGVSQEENAPTLPVTRILITPKLPTDWTADLSRLVVHFQMTLSGILTRVAKTQLDVPDFAPPGIPLDGLVEPLPDGVSTSGQLLLQDANDNGVLVDGSTQIDSQGKGNVTLGSNSSGFNPRLRTPVRVFGNLIRASRGETVLDEVLGSGDSSESFQAFTLTKSPLTYLNDPSANGRRSTLTIRVNGILWQEVPSFFGIGPQAEVYIVRQNDQQETTVTFGDGVTGVRLPTGIDNITATYRFGAGATKPPVGAIAQLAKPVAGLRRVVNPVAAGGGADGDRPQDIRRNAPNSALLLGRAVSVQDFEALAREFGGVINAKVEWAWDETCQRAVVKVWFISDGGDIEQELKTFLLGQADPNTPLVTTEAVAQPSQLLINLTLDPRFTPQTVVEEVRQTLTNSETGILALENIPIGRSLFRSQIFAAVLAVSGTCSVSAMTVDGNPVPFAISVSEGHYRHFLNHLVISIT